MVLNYPLSTAIVAFLLTADACVEGNMRVEDEVLLDISTEPATSLLGTPKSKPLTHSKALTYLTIPVAVVTITFLFLTHFPQIGSNSMLNRFNRRLSYFYGSYRDTDGVIRDMEARPETANVSQTLAKLPSNYVHKIDKIASTTRKSPTETTKNDVTKTVMAVAKLESTPSGVDRNTNLIVGSDGICRKGKERLLNNEHLKRMVPDFVRVYDERPESVNLYGTGIHHQFAMWSVIRTLRPEHIIESGVMHGYGTWIMRQAAPDAQLILLDKLRSRIKYWDPKPDTINFMGPHKFRDFRDIHWENETFANKPFNPARALVFFDDHRSAVNRLITAHKHGFRHVMFDDNYSPREQENESPVDSFSLKMACEVVLGRLPLDKMYGNFRLSQKEKAKAQTAFDLIDIYQELPTIWPVWNSFGNFVLKERNEYQLFRDWNMTNIPDTLNRKYHFIAYVRLKR